MSFYFNPRILPLPFLGNGTSGYMVESFHHCGISEHGIDDVQQNLSEL